MAENKLADMSTEKVYHYTDKANLDSIMHSGLKTTSRYESF